MLDTVYQLLKPIVFSTTKNDPQVAHEFFIRFCQDVHKLGLEDIVFGRIDHNKLFNSDISISNAAGFNKNGDIPLSILYRLGFDRVVVGTVTAEEWAGNPRPTIRRYTGTESLVNWMGLPGIGARRVAENLFSIDDCASYFTGRPDITINLMATPGKQGDEALRDLQTTIEYTMYAPGVTRYELNISCPNTHSSSGAVDAREENLRMLDSMLSAVSSEIDGIYELYVKVSPDSTEQDVIDTVSVAKKYNISGVVTTNTTTVHDPRYIPESPRVDGVKIGGASGKAVYDRSFLTQLRYVKAIMEEGLDWDVIACGGIDSVEKKKERIKYGAIELQVFTPIIYKGPKLIQDFRKCANHFNM